MFLETPEESFSNTSIGLSPKIGFTFSPVDFWKIKVELGHFKSFYGIKKEYIRSKFDQRFSLYQNLDFRFEIEYFENLEGSFVLHYFW